jgi:hypothetical protein
MKSDHRRELKSNELAEWLKNFPTWAKENLTKIIIFSVIVIVAAGGYIYLRYTEDVLEVRSQVQFTNQIKQLDQQKIVVLQSLAQGMDFSANLLKPATALKAVSNAAKNDHMAAMALIKSGQSYRTELHYRPGVVSQQQIVTQIKKAKAAYMAAIEKASANPSLEASAKLGLALCEEEVQNFEGAMLIYMDLTTTEEYKNTVAVVQAERRLKTLNDYKTRLVFMPAPVTPVVQPQIDFSEPPKIELPIEINLPTTTQE